MIRCPTFVYEYKVIECHSWNKHDENGEKLCAYIIFVQISQEYIYIHISIFRWLILVHVHAFWKYSSNVKCLWYECLKGLEYYLNWWINDETESITACSRKDYLHVSLKFASTVSDILTGIEVAKIERIRNLLLMQ